VPENVVPDEVRLFLKDHVSSIEQLEVLLLLRASPERAWPVKEVYQRVLTNESSIQQSLEKLSEHGLVSRVQGESAYQFSGGAPDMLTTLDRLAILYKERPTRVVHELYGATPSEIDEFAKAFKIRRDSK
jgi:hypothetical protein